MKLEDCCPPIQDPENAVTRLEGCEYLYWARQEDDEDGKKIAVDVSDDRYLETLEGVERRIAGMVSTELARGYVHGIIC
jgi:hypothetical protein